MKKLFIISTFLLFTLNLAFADSSPAKKHPFNSAIKNKKEQIHQQIQDQLKFAAADPEIQYGNPGNSSEYFWAMDDWFHSTDVEYHYNENGILIEQIMTDPIMGMNLYKTTYTYDEHGNLTEILSYTYYEGWELSYGSRSLYTYDENGNILEMIFQYYDGYTGVWENSHRDLYTYDENGHMIAQVFQYWWNDVWENDYKEEYTVNELGEWLTFVSYLASGEDWEMYEQAIDIVWHNFENLEVSSAIIQMYSGGMWYDNERITGTYSGEEYVIIYEMYWGETWNLYERETFTIVGMEHIYLIEYHNSEMWENSSRDTEYYDDHGNYSGAKYEYWESEKSSLAGWVVNYFDFLAHTYDENDNLIETVNQTWDYEAEELVNFSKSVFSNFTSDVPEVGADLGLSVFPNPVQRELNIVDLNVDMIDMTYHLTDIHGKVLQSGTLEMGNQVVDMSQLAMGFYFLQVRNMKNQASTYKILKN